MLSGLAVVVHVAMVLWLVAGILGRDRCYSQAAITDELSVLQTMVRLGSIFETTMVRPGTTAVLISGLIAAWARGWPILGFLQGAPVNWVLASLLLYLTAIPLIMFVFIPRGKVYRAALNEAIERGAVTDRLRAALRDPVVEAARAYEVGMVVALVFLMITKPF